MGTGSFPEVKWPERGDDHPSHSAVLRMDWAYASAFPVCQHVHVMGRFLPLHKITNISGSLEPTFKRCCVLGSNWAAEDLKCNNFPAPVAGVAPEQQSVCLSAVEICCLRKHRWVKCEVHHCDWRVLFSALKMEALRFFWNVSKFLLN